MTATEATKLQKTEGQLCTGDRRPTLRSESPPSSGEAAQIFLRGSEELTLLQDLLIEEVPFIEDVGTQCLSMGCISREECVLQVDCKDERTAN